MRSVEQTRMPLGDHLDELRRRLIRVLASVFVLAGLSFAFAKDLYGLLMRPVLLALPSGSSALVYTSAIEELNVYLKVGLYAGLCLSMPVALWQLWAFIAPGLYASERRLAGPFVLGGTLAFLAGTAFCYLALLPPMFTFLLRDAEQVELADALALARLREQTALGALARGDLARAEAETLAALQTLEDAGPSGSAIRPPREELEVLARLEGLGRLLDAATRGPGAPDDALAHQADAVEACAAGLPARAREASDRAAQALAASRPEARAAVDALWRLEAALGTSLARQEASRWTRPMLSMSQQLSLVLVLELATGVVFELPLVMALLALLGLVESGFLMRYQRHAFVVCIVAAAFITPTGDVVNLTLMAGPILVCFEAGVLAVWLVERRRRRASHVLVG